MHGVKLSPKTMPSSGEARAPSRGATLGRHPDGAGSQPAKAAPSTMITTPSAMVISRALVSSTEPRPPISAPVSTKTMENPRMKPSVPPTSSRLRPVPSAISAVPSPEA